MCRYLHAHYIFCIFNRPAPPHSTVFIYHIGIYLYDGVLIISFGRHFTPIQYTQHNIIIMDIISTHLIAIFLVLRRTLTFTHIYFLEYLLLLLLCESCSTKYTCNFTPSPYDVTSRRVSVAINNQSLLGRSRRCLR